MIASVGNQVVTPKSVLAGRPAVSAPQPQDVVQVGSADPAVPAALPPPACPAPLQQIQTTTAGRVGKSLVPGPTGVALQSVPVVDPNELQAGFACGTFLRPDPFFADRTQMVVHAARTPNNPTGIVELPAGQTKVIQLEQLVSGKNEILIGFGMPRVFTVVPKVDGSGYQQLDARAFFKRKAKVASADTVLSGVFIRPRNLPPEAAASLRTAMREMAGHRAISTAHANAEMLADAGFTSGGRSLRGKLTPLRLFKGIVDHGLEYHGHPVKFDIVSTTPQTIDEHFRNVVHKEITDPNPTGGTTPTAPTSTVHPAPGPVDNNPRTLIRNSRPDAFGSAMRSLIGAHILWEAVPDQKRVDINQFLPVTLKDKFDDNKPLTKGEKIKKMLFKPGTVKLLRKGLGNTFDDAGEFTGSQLASMMRIPGDGEEIKPDDKGLIKYNIVICGNQSVRGNRIVIARLE
ncbi:MAG: hypothetical protein ACYCW6_28170, partial [Candidatus Xenobia bacterium]